MMNHKTSLLQLVITMFGDQCQRLGALIFFVDQVYLKKKGKCIVTGFYESAYELLIETGY